jgi:hypothetical protein
LIVGILSSVYGRAGATQSTERIRHSLHPLVHRVEGSAPGLHEQFIVEGWAQESYGSAYQSPLGCARFVVSGDKDYLYGVNSIKGKESRILDLSPMPRRVDGEWKSSEGEGSSVLCGLEGELNACELMEARWRSRTMMAALRLHCSGTPISYPNLLCEAH